jgi:hypothetical protein
MNLKVTVSMYVHVNNVEGNCHYVGVFEYLRCVCE